MKKEAFIFVVLLIIMSSYAYAQISGYNSTGGNSTLDTLINDSLSNNYPNGCVIATSCNTNYTFIGTVQDSGHYNQSNKSSSKYYLCCSKTYNISKAIYGKQNITFKFTTDGHVSDPGASTLPNKEYVGTNNCYVSSTSCSENSSFVPFFNMSSNTNAHMADYTNGSIPEPSNFGYTLCCQTREQCFNGIDDDGDGLIDCADPDCNGAPTSSNPQPPQICTGSPYNTSGCVIGYTHPDATTINIQYNQSCLNTNDNTYYYCSYGHSDNRSQDPVGVCCPAGKEAIYDAKNGWQCRDTELCRNWCPPAQYDFQYNTTSWLNNIYNTDPLNWCNSQWLNPYSPDTTPNNIISTGCCLVTIHGETNYYTDPGNIKVFG